MLNAAKSRKCAILSVRPRIGLLLVSFVLDFFEKNDFYLIFDFSN